jgi:hypothetical protein
VRNGALLSGAFYCAFPQLTIFASSLHVAHMPPFSPNAGRYKIVNQLASATGVRCFVNFFFHIVDDSADE